ncbi:60S ribosomal protein L23a-like [Sorex fumeus]|uniref:60S ribosomal protein L23a-like n=1 Tax=Sorex fumeus TaxID=62283 RepID=UPI0024AE0593|nr:60S ribosomal protein L23a-like [Sorex fumeus]
MQTIYTKITPKPRRKSASSKVEAKAKTLNAKKSELKGVYKHKKTCASSPPLKSVSKRNKLDHCVTIKCSLTTKSARKKIETENTLIFIVGINANKHWIEQLAKMLHDIYVAKVNTPTRPDGEKFDVHLTPYYGIWMLLTKLGSSK